MSDLVQTQRELEEKAADQGALKFLAQTQKAREAGRGGETASGYRFMAQAVRPLAEALRAWIEGAASGAGRNHSALKQMQSVDPEVSAYIGLKVLLNAGHKPRPEKVLWKRIGEALNAEANLAVLNKEAPAHAKAILKVAGKKSEADRKVYAAATMLAKAESVTEWTHNQKLVVGAVVVKTMERIGVAEVVRISGSRNKRAHTRNFVQVSQEIIEFLLQADEKIAAISATFEPMVVKPRAWKTPYTGAYLTKLSRQVRLVKTRSKELLQDMKEQDLSQVYSALNKIQGTPYRINEEMLTFLEEAVETDARFGGLPPASEKELPNKEDYDMNDPESLRAYKSKSVAAIEENLRLRSRRVSIIMNLKTARKFSKYPEIYIPVQLDWRGRVYCVPNLNYQGEDFMKSLFEFAEGKPLGEEGADWLAFHLANLWGNDKVDLESRKLWTHLHTKEILSYVEDPWENRGWTEADKPFCFLAACLEWAGYIKEGPSFVSHLGVALDGSCSGLQNYAMALRCEETGSAVNLLPSERPQDIYQRVADKVRVRVQADLGMAPESPREAVEAHALDAMLAIYNKEAPKEDWEEFKARTLGTFQVDGELIKRTPAQVKARQAYDKIMLAWGWLQIGIDRKTAKRSVMTYPYGASKFGFADQLKDDILKDIYEDYLDWKQQVEDGTITPENHHRWNFPDSGFGAAKYLAGHLWEGIQETVVKASEAMDWLQKVASIWLKETGTPIEWVAPNGLLCRQKYLETRKRTVKTRLYGKLLEFQTREETDKLDTRKGANGIAPNFIHSLDASHLMHTVNHSGLENFMLIHDSFATHASDTGTLFYRVRASFAEMYTEHDVFQDFYERVCSVVSDPSSVPPPPAKGNLDLSLVLKSSFAFA